MFKLFKLKEIKNLFLSVFLINVSISLLIFLNNIFSPTIYTDILYGYIKIIVFYLVVFGFLISLLFIAIFRLFKIVRKR